MNTDRLPLVSDRAPSPAMIAVAGMFVLALAMGIGRFAFTALLPLAREQGLLTLHSAGWLAAVNYGGYLTGALWVVRGRSAHTAQRLGMGLVFSIATTLAMGWDLGLAGWMMTRFVAGIASAWVYIYATGMVLRALVHAHASGWSALHYPGVGAGITLSACVAQVLLDQRAATAWGWWILGGGAALVALPAVVVLIRAESFITATHSAPTNAARDTTRHPPLGWMAAAYGLAGFGYIVNATFLPTLLRAQPGVADAALTGWLVVGLAALPATALWVHLGLQLGAYPALIACTLLEAAGVALPVLWPGQHLPALAGAALLGGTFMGIAGLAQWLARVPDPQATSRRIGFVTACYGIGQIAGPLATSGLARGDDLTAPVLLAASALILSAGLFEVSRRVERLV
ncbi:MAG: YbfB/YjiJ family MFS transporter [Gammaproteobacteria bacterium]|nr:YbfB/YjiJ family MFS transporter [Gammaproteobacteria bacterium]